MDQKTITSNPEIDKEIWDRLQDRLEEIDPSRNYSDKHITELALKISDHLLKEKIESMNSNIDQIKREINQLEDILK